MRGNKDNLLKCSTRAERKPLQVWGGVECTCNRVGDRFFDQTDLSGHATRMDDFAAIAGLGIKTLRSGLLWERFERHGWGAFDAQVACMQELGIDPIAGLLHHGSGPARTSLLDPGFPEALAAYAGRVAERYPWITRYTPVNEPNTTARFSGLYGVWYPHHMSRASYLRALLHELKATVLSMHAIRRVRPDAQLVQTEDVGNISGTEELRPVWEALNARQWLPFDLLCGEVGRHHPLFPYLRAEGISESEILWFSDHPCPPDVIGINCYVTSDRYLDHRLDLYPEDRRSAEGPFVDVEAVRVHTSGVLGAEPLLREAWRRYEIPIAITEVHLGCSADEQIRWLNESLRSMHAAQDAGVECVALTVWALLGSFYWDQLVTCANGHYEPGAFDVRSGRPVATELAEVVAQIARGEAPSHPALSERGWWRRPSRSCFPWPEVVAA